MSLDGFDIDKDFEVTLWLNGAQIGNLTVGPNNRLNGGDRFILSASSQSAGFNVLAFKQYKSTWKWGVTNLLLTENN